MNNFEFEFRQNTRTWQTPRRTDGQTPHDGTRLSL